MNVLITRPINQCSSIAKAVQTLGHTPVIFPTIDIIDPDVIPTSDEVNALLSDAQIAVFISPSAVEKTIAMVHKLPSHIKVATIGKGTARTLKECNITVDIQPEVQFNSEGLLAHPALQAVVDQLIVIFKGEGGRELLTNTLKQRGAVVHELSMYQRQCPEVDVTPLMNTWKNEGIDVIISTSSESLKNLFTLLHPVLGDALLTIPLLMISERIQSQAEQLGFQKRIVTEYASDEAILDALKTL